MGACALLGSLMVPEMIKRGYNKYLSMGPIMGVGGLAVIIPPSALTVLLATLGQTDVGDLLIAGIAAFACVFVTERGSSFGYNNLVVDMRSLAIMRETGASKVWTRLPNGGNRWSGGTRMGSDPKTSVVNGYGQAHDMPNLFVMGASTFPQNQSYNPTGPLGASAYWSANAIVTQYLKSPGPLVHA